MKNIANLLYEAIGAGIKSGKELDQISIRLGMEMLDAKEGNPFFQIKLNNIDVLELFYNESDFNFWYIDGCFFNFVAYYKDNKDFPLGRAYYIAFSGMFSATYLWEKLYRGIKLSSEEDVANLVGHDTFQRRIVEFKENKNCN